MKYSIKYRLLQEMTQKQSWQQVEKIITKIAATIEAYGDIEVNRKDRRNVKFMSKRTAANKMGFEPSLFPEAEARPAIYIGPEDWDPFDPAAKSRGTNIIKVFTPYPWGTGEQHQLKISDVINDNGASLYELIIQLLEKLE